ncbi:MAG: YtxH domain-containing protein [Bacteroidota bacterium]|nr:YtxH domain-containing protein [Bacteroidota bacterium]MDP4212034.1 YtxH domain-containing protein [Bacteroidota bacterium]MDP4249601.1 YtxH domain-containing protein [Bacteroidota bacterium]
MMTSKKLIAGILTGLAAGAMISLIISSNKKGSFGKKLMKKGNNLADDLKEKFGEFVDRMEDKFQGILK